MATLSITKTATYGTGYSVTGTINLEASSADRKTFTLSASTSTKIYAQDIPPTATGKLAYLYIQNTGAASAYIAIYDGTNNPPQHEIPAGGDQDFFGKDIWGTILSSPDTLLQIWARGNTTIEVDIFL